MKITHLLLITFSILKSQEIPNEFFDFKVQKLLMDSGFIWSKNSTLGFNRFQSINDNNGLKNDSLYIKSRFGITRLNSSAIIYGFGHFRYKKYLYGYLYPRIVNKPSLVDRYTGVPRPIKRNGFVSGETDQSGIGFQNSWLMFQIGRGRENWGAGNNIQISLSEDSPSYDYFALASNYGNVSVKYIHGFLESTVEGYNRYINSRGLEWKNNKSILIGISETIIYSGLNRSLEFGYLNPIASHLEVELNDRLNILGTEHSNALWQISIDFLPFKNLRISGNYLYDEYVIDQIEIDHGKEHGDAFSFRLSYSPSLSLNDINTFFVSYINIGTPTFRHSNPNNNFVQRSKPLGWQGGSDCYQIKIGHNWYNNKNLISNLSFEYLLYGEENLIFSPYKTYKDHLKGKFPSGKNTNGKYFNYEVQWWIKDNISLINHIKIKDSLNQIEIKLGLDIFLNHKLFDLLD